MLATPHLNELMSKHSASYRSQILRQTIGNTQGTLTAKGLRSSHEAEAANRTRSKKAPAPKSGKESTKNSPSVTYPQQLPARCIVAGHTRAARVREIETYQAVRTGIFQKNGEGDRTREAL
jgi:hypothetical protein